MSKDFSSYNGNVQVSTAHYDLAKYLDLGRWNSYWHQIEETLAFRPESVLIVGKGDNVVGTILAQQGVKVTTFDFDESLQPDIIGNIIDIKNILQGKKFDVLLCCQVLEHLPYAHFENILQQFTTIADKVVISLPYSIYNYVEIEMKLPIIKRVRLRSCVPRFFKKCEYNGQHYWEIGFSGYSRRKIRKSIEKFFVVTKQFPARHNGYHLFFILQQL
jgi:hypothetical protein